MFSFLTTKKYTTFFYKQKDKVVKDKKEDKKNKGKAKESTEPEANEENHSENGEAKSNAVQFTNLLIFIFYKFSTGFRSKCLFNIVQISTYLH